MKDEGCASVGEIESGGLLNSVSRRASTNQLTAWPAG